MCPLASENPSQSGAVFASNSPIGNHIPIDIIEAMVRLRHAQFFDE
jgi:hypothetical protein